MPGMTGANMAGMRTVPFTIHNAFSQWNFSIFPLVVHTVYRALDRRLGREVAVKVIHPHLRDSPEVVSRFNTEARAVAKLRHPNIVEVFDVSDPDEPEQYLVVELLGGTTLRKLLQRHKAMPPEGGRGPGDRAARGARTCACQRCRAP